MLPTTTLIKRLTYLQQGGVNDIIRDFVADENQNILDLNRNNQLYDKGLRADGSKVKPAYTSFTKKIKKEKGQVYDRVTLKDTGDFYNSFKLNLTSFDFEIGATDSKTDELTAKYGEGIFGLTIENKRKLSDKLAKTLLIKIRKRI